MNNKDNYKGAKIISFIFPLIGLIIYAVNVGKNDKLAKECAKWALIGVFIVPLILFLLYLCLFASYDKAVDNAISKTKIPVAKITINAREIITEDMIEYKEISKAIVNNSKHTIITDINSIIGKYVSYSCVIPKGSLFYDDNCLKTKEEMPDTNF